MRNTWSKANVDVQCVAIQGHNVQCSRTRIMVHLVTYVLHGCDSAMMVTVVSVLCALSLLPVCWHVGISTAQPFYSKKVEQGVLEVRQILTFSFCLSIKCPCWICVGTAQLLAGRASWALEGSCHLQGSPVLEGHKKKKTKKTHLYFLQKWAEIPALAKNLSLPGLHRPQPAQQNTHQNSTMILCSVVAWERGRIVIFTADCSGTLHH